MEIADRINAARDQLNRTLGFFSRVDSKASVVLGVNTGVLGVLAARALPYSALRWEWVPIGLTIGLLAFSYWHLYKAASPSLDGGQESLLYFREIAKRTEAKYGAAWMSITDDEYLKDLVGQVWRNSEILTQKFTHTKYAFNALALALVPWLISLVALALRVSTP
jgi:hypothetical protein